MTLDKKAGSFCVYDRFYESNVRWLQPAKKIYKDFVQFVHVCAQRNKMKFCKCLYGCCDRSLRKYSVFMRSQRLVVINVTVFGWVRAFAFHYESYTTTATHTGTVDMYCSSTFCWFVKWMWVISQMFKSLFPGLLIYCVTVSIKEGKLKKSCCSC